MDQRRMDAEGGRVIYRGRRARKLAVVVAVQNLLVVACLLATFWVYSDLPFPEKTVHMEFEPIATVLGNATLEFPFISSSHKMHLTKDNKTIITNCTGPYIWYMVVCYEGHVQNGSRGKLVLQVTGSDRPAGIISLNATLGVCRGLSSTVYLWAKKLASVQLTCEKDFILNNMTMGLSSLLGNRCEF